MNSKELVLKTLLGQKVDRVPLNVFAGWNPGMRNKIEEKYGTIDQFMDKFHLDIVTGVMPRFPFGNSQIHPEIQELDKYLEIDPMNPNTSEFLKEPCDKENLFLTVAEALTHKNNNKAVFIHAWGQQNTMLFDPKLWWEMIFPAIKIVIDAAKKHHVPVILHSDGDVTQVLDGIKQLGISCLHPVQESAGMSYTKVREIFGRNIGIMGGLDIVSAVSVMSSEEIKQEVSRIFKLLKHSGPSIFCSSHMFQDNDSLEVIETAYQTAYELSHF